jgi:hypothetical protein
MDAHTSVRAIGRIGCIAKLLSFLAFLPKKSARRFFRDVPLGQHRTIRTRRLCAAFCADSASKMLGIRKDSSAFVLVPRKHRTANPTMLILCGVAPAFNLLLTFGTTNFNIDRFKKQRVREISGPFFRRPETGAKERNFAE